MSLWDKIGDVADALGDTVHESLGTALDIAKAVEPGNDYGWNDFKHGLAQHAQRSNVGTVIGAELSPFGTDTPAGGAVLGGLAAAQHATSHAISTVTAFGGEQGGLNALNPNLYSPSAWRQEWRKTQEDSPVQALAGGILQGSGKSINGVPVTIANVSSFGAGGRNYDPLFSAVTGAGDLTLSWFADPAVVAGKSVSLARKARETLQAGDLGAISEGTDLTRRQSKLKNRFEALVTATRGKNAAQLYQFGVFRDNEAGDTIATLIAQANKTGDPVTRDNQVRRILGLGFGDIDLARKLKAEGDSLGDDLANLTDGLDHLFSLPEDARVSMRIMDVQDEIGRRSRYLDELDKMLGAVKTDAQGNKVAIPGALFSLGDQIPQVGAGDYRRLARLQDDRILQDGISSTPIKIKRWASGYRPNGWVDMHSSQDVVQNVERMLERVRGMDPARKTELLNHVVTANDDAARQIAVQHVEAAAFAHVAKGFGLSGAQADALVKNVQDRRSAVLRTWSRRAYSGATDDAGKRVDLHLDTDGSYVARPVTEAQLADHLPLLDIDNAYRVLKRESKNNSLYNAWDASLGVTQDVGNQFNQLWKLGTLMRLGYMVRTVGDAQIRLLSTLGGLGYVSTASQGFANLTRNKLGKIEVQTAQDILERAQAQSRLDEIHSVLAHSAEYQAVGETAPKMTKAVAGRETAVGTDVPPRLPVSATPPDMYGTKYDLGAMRQEKADLEDRLSQRPQTITRKRTKEERLRQGKGTIQVNGYTVPDAHGETNDELLGSMRLIDANQSSLHMFGQIEAAQRSRMRMMGGNFVLLNGQDAGYEAAWMRAVNYQLKQSAVGSKVIDGWSDGKIKRWLISTPEGRDVSRRMRAVYGDDRDEMVQATRATVDHALGSNPALYDIARQRNVTVDDLKQTFMSEEHYPPINGAQIDATTGTGPFVDLYNKSVEKFYHYMNDVPETVMGRHPLYVQLYRRKIQALVRNADAQTAGKGTGLTGEELASMSQSARAWARSEMKRTLFHIAAKSNLSAAPVLKFIFPFFSAWEDVFQKYGRLVVNDPSLLAHALQIWQAPEKAGLTINKDGDIVQAGDDTASLDNQFVLVPSIPGISSIAKWRLSKSSANIILQGDPFWLPGFGPLAAVPANEIVKRKPNLEAEFKKAGILPFGAQESSLSLLNPLPRSLQQLHRAFNPDDSQYKQTYSYILATETMRYRNGDRKNKPSMGEIAGRARNWYIARAFASGVLPISATPVGKYQFYFDEAHRYQQKYGQKAEQKFYQDYPEYFEASISLSKNNTGIQATNEGVQAAHKWRDQIAKNPEYGWFFVGPEDDGQFSSAARVNQLDTRVAPGSSMREREKKDPQQALQDLNSSKGWIQYRSVMDRLDAVMTQRGLSSMRVQGAQDLAAFKQGFVAALARDNPDWMRDYEQRDEGKVRAFLQVASDTVNDPKAKGRADLDAMRVYLTAREKIKAVLDARKAAGGAGSLDAQANADLSNWWSAFGTVLKNRYVTFSDVYTRMLERDNLSAGVSNARR